MLPAADLSFASLAVHAGREDFATLGVHTPPLDLSSTYPVPDPDGGMRSLDALVAGAGAPPDGAGASGVYARLFNPTVARFEGALARLEGAAAGVAFGSGMAALTAVLLAAAQDGRHVVAVRPLYGTSDHLLGCGLLPIETTFVAPDGVADALRADTALVLVETPANPTLDLVDVADVVRQARSRGRRGRGSGPVPVLVDSTFATPVLQRPLALGADLVLHSATKFLGGHGDVIAGVVATGEPWARRLRQVRVLTGALLHPLGAYLLHRGLPTLPLRVERAQATAGTLARRLLAHRGVTRVCWPGLEGCDPHGLVGRQMAGPGSVLAFEVDGGHDAAVAFMRALRLATPAVSLGSVDSLIQHPAGLTHRVVDPGARAATGITEGLLRLSVGLESADDLWADLERGFAAVGVAGSAGADVRVRAGAVA